MRSEAGGSAPRLHGSNDIVPMVEALQWQADHVRERGSPTAGVILDAVIRDLDTGGPLAGILPPAVRFGDLPGLRTMAAVHRLALERLAPSVAPHLPTLGGTAPLAEPERSAFMAAVVVTLVTHADVLMASLARAPQTNETGRAPLLRCALSRLDSDLPVRLREIGASAGLNLRADHLPGVIELEAGPLPRIIDRLGCDLFPIDPTTPDGRLTLSSFVWVDDVERFERLGAALLVAQRVPATVIAQDAGDFVDDLDLVDGTATVLWHSALWVYLPSEVTTRVLAAIDELGGRANATRQFVHASWEWNEAADQDVASQALVVRRWRGREDDGNRQVVARGHSHGGEARLVSDHRG